MSAFSDKVKRLSGLVVATLLAAGGVFAAAETLEVFNPSFELGEGWPDGWEPVQGNTVRPSLGSVLAWDKEFSRSGKRSLYLRKESVGPLFWRVTTAVAVEPGGHYRVRVWYRIPAGYNSSLRAGVTGARQPGEGHPWSTSMGRDASFDPDNEWQEFIMDFQIPETVDQVFISLSNGGSGRTEGEVNEVWFDDVSIERIDSKE